MANLSRFRGMFFYAANRVRLKRSPLNKNERAELTIMLVLVHTRAEVLVHFIF